MDASKGSSPDPPLDISVNRRLTVEFSNSSAQHMTWRRPEDAVLVLPRPHSGPYRGEVRARRRCVAAHGEGQRRVAPLVIPVQPPVASRREFIIASIVVDLAAVVVADHREAGSVLAGDAFQDREDPRYIRPAREDDRPLLLLPLLPLLPCPPPLLLRRGTSCRDDELLEVLLPLAQEHVYLR